MLRVSLQLFSHVISVILLSMLNVHLISVNEIIFQGLFKNNEDTPIILDDGVSVEDKRKGKKKSSPVKSNKKVVSPLKKKVVSCYPEVTLL